MNNYIGNNNKYNDIKFTREMNRKENYNTIAHKQTKHKNNFIWCTCGI